MREVILQAIELLDDNLPRMKLSCDRISKIFRKYQIVLYTGTIEWPDLDINSNAESLINNLVDEIVSSKIYNSHQGRIITYIYWRLLLIDKQYIKFFREPYATQRMFIYVVTHSLDQPDLIYLIPRGIYDRGLKYIIFKHQNYSNLIIHCLMTRINTRIMYNYNIRYIVLRSIKEQDFSTLIGKYINYDYVVTLQLFNKYWDFCDRTKLEVPQKVYRYMLIYFLPAYIKKREFLQYASTDTMIYVLYRHINKFCKTRDISYRIDEAEALVNEYKLDPLVFKQVAKKLLAMPFTKT